MMLPGCVWIGRVRGAWGSRVPTRLAFRQGRQLTSQARFWKWLDCRALLLGRAARDRQPRHGPLRVSGFASACATDPAPGHRAIRARLPKRHRDARPHAASVPPTATCAPATSTSRSPTSTRSQRQHPTTAFSARARRRPLGDGTAARPSSRTRAIAAPERPARRNLAVDACEWSNRPTPPAHGAVLHNRRLSAEVRYEITDIWIAFGLVAAAWPSDSCPDSPSLFPPRHHHARAPRPQPPVSAPVRRTRRAATDPGREPMLNVLQRDVPRQLALPASPP
jgi:hypothetical protein